MFVAKSLTIPLLFKTNTIEFIKISMSVLVAVHHVHGVTEYVQIQMAAMFAHVQMGGLLVKITAAVLVSCF